MKQAKLRPPLPLILYTDKCRTIFDHLSRTNMDMPRSLSFLVFLPSPGADVSLPEMPRRCPAFHLRLVFLLPCACILRIKQFRVETNYRGTLNHHKLLGHLFCCHLLFLSWFTYTWRHFMGMHRSLLVG
jgi:hypothetical protein